MPAPGVIASACRIRLSRDKGIAGFLREFLRLVQHRSGFRREIDLAACTLHFGQFGQGDFVLLPGFRSATTSRLNQAGGHPLLIVQQDLENMFRSQKLMI